MKMTKIVTLEQGVEKAKRKIERVKRIPILVATYGWPHSGKSHFIHLVGEYFKKQGLSVGKYGGGPRPETFETIRDRPQVVNDLLLFHCGWERRNDGLFADEDPNILAGKILGRTLDFNVGIYNPHMRDIPLGEYNIIICNPDSKIKQSE